ncbi:MAG: FAD-binding oxidoreductase [Actinobacteria bacterium]|nr:FAD-binding oxidoreductase [Actinomycetota bacterium]
MTDYRAISMWHDTAGDDFSPRPSLGGPTDVDVAVVGAGYTGLWTAYYLKKADPSLRVAVVEREVAGFGGSGRHGGWCSARFATPREKMEAVADRQGVIDMQRAMFDTVYEVGRVVESEGIECDFHLGGNLVFATNRAQIGTVRDKVLNERTWGFGEEDFRLLGSDEAREYVPVEGALGAIYCPHSARVHPTKLARGLARVVEAQGVPIYESTPALDITRGGVDTPAGRMKAEVVVRATESYTVDLPGMRRSLVPVYSLMIATEPLGDEVWRELGWTSHATWADARHLIIYAARTADGRIALGGRGTPYHLGSRIDAAYEQDPAVFAMLKNVLGGLLPAAAAARVSHTWGGPVAIPRDWTTSTGYDRAAGLAWADGYVGNGVSTTNLAGRTLADLITGADTALTKLSWVNHRSRRWEPEPLRWLGVNLATKMMVSADRVEVRTGRRSNRAALTQRLIGR